MADERVFQDTGLRVRAVEAGDLGAARGLGGIGHQTLDLAEHVARLGVLVRQLADDDRNAVADVGPQLLGELAAVVGDHTVAGGEDVLRRAVVALELDDRDRLIGSREVVLEVEDVADIGSAEAENRLEIVPDDKEVFCVPREQLQQPVLRVVRVLVLVDKDVAESRLIAREHLGEQLEDVDGPHQQIVEVHRVHPHQLGLVERVRLGDRAFPPVALSVREVGGRLEFVLGLGDTAGDRRRREPLGVGADLVEAALDEPAGVGSVVDREMARVAEPWRLGAQDPRAGGVERHHPHAARRVPEQPLGALAHLARGLVRERDREDLAAAGASAVDEVGDPVRQDARLAGAGAGEHEQRPVAVQDGGALLVVEPFEQVDRTLLAGDVRGHEPRIEIGPVAATWRCGTGRSRPSRCCSPRPSRSPRRGSCPERAPSSRSVR